ncbi:MAG: hypothetical protein L0220_00695 [Acidobacteria bacterium]|nr:hypothetical protein [Acidobacteriota bacterium]
MSSQISDLINPMRLRLGIKRAFTGDVNEILNECIQNSMRAGAQNIQITTDDRGFIYQDDGRGLRDESDFEDLVILGESGWDQHIEEEQMPLGLGIHCLLAHDEIESVTFSSNHLSLTLDAKRWFSDSQYAVGWRDNLSTISFPAPGMNIIVKCSKALTANLIQALTDGWLIHRSPARGYHDLLYITLNGTVVDTSVQEGAMPSVSLIDTFYQKNRLIIGLHGKEGYGTQNGIWVNFYGQMIAVDRYSHFQAYLEVRQGRPVNPMSPSRRGIIKDEALNSLCDFVRDSLSEYFSQTSIGEIDPLALQQFYHDYPAKAAKLPCFVAARRKRYESGDDVGKITTLFAPEVLSYQKSPLLLTEKVRIIQEDETIDSSEYGLHTFLELTGVAYKVLEADESRLDIRSLWWKPGEQIPLASGCLQIFHKAGQWGLGTEKEPPSEWREIDNHVVFAFNHPNNWDIANVDITVGGADPQDFYQTDAWAGFNPQNGEGRSKEEMTRSYRESCEREIRNLIGNAVPKNFSWDDLLRFVPEGEQIVAVTPEYKSRRKHRPVSIIIMLSKEEMVRLRLF